MATKQQTEGIGFLVFDETCLQRGELLKRYKAQGFFVQAKTPEELAQKLGIDPKGLKATLADWKVVYDTKKDAQFGRKDSIFSAIDRAPFYGQKTSRGQSGDLWRCDARHRGACRDAGRQAD